MFRTPTADELRLLGKLAAIAGLTGRDAWLAALRVRELHDGGMGSLELASQTRAARKRTVCRPAVQFTDEDGIEVIASLYEGDDGAPFELDVWKTDFSRLICIGRELRKVD